MSASAQAVGFNVYDGSNLVATANPSDDGFGVSSGEWQYKDANPKTFGVQVFNYVQDTPISYTLCQIGAQ